MIYQALLLLFSVSACAGWSSVSTLPTKYMQTQRCVLSMRRGRGGGLGKEIGSSTSSGGMGSSSSSMAGGAGGRTDINWIPIQVSAKSLPTTENKVELIDTNLITMKNAQTNPTGAVSVMKYGKQTYCFSVNCPSCKIPLTKAQALEGTKESSNQPRLVCDFCKATYNLKTGTKLESAVPNPGILGGIAKSIFSAKDNGPLPVYQLGEKNGKLVIALEQKK